jgi:hypothetical protein
MAWDLIKHRDNFTVTLLLKAWYKVNNICMRAVTNKYSYVVHVLDLTDANVCCTMGVCKSDERK